MFDARLEHSEKSANAVEIKMSDYKMPPKKRGRGGKKQDPIPIVPELLIALENGMQRAICDEKN